MNQNVSLKTILGDEGFRLFFILSAVYAAVWPLQWVVLLNFNLPFSQTTPTSFWHAHELIFGAFGAALIGFITTAMPEWTDTQKPQGKFLFPLAILWVTGRLVGFWGADILSWLGAIADILCYLALMAYVAKISWLKRSSKFLAFIFWISLLAVCDFLLHYSFAIQDFTLSQKITRLATLGFLGLLGLALARITIGVTNIVLDPSQTTAPYRPHPGRLNLAPGLVAIALIGEILNASPEVSAYLLIAAGAGFMDRTAEWFVGKIALRSELLVLGVSSLLAGTGLITMGLSRLGAPIAEITGLHIALMGGLGMGILAVFSIAGLLHAHKDLVFKLGNKISIVCLLAAVICRVLPDYGWFLWFPGSAYSPAAIFWFLAFAIWVKMYWPIFTDPQTLRS